MLILRESIKYFVTNFESKRITFEEIFHNGSFSFYSLVGRKSYGVFADFIPFVVLWPMCTYLSLICIDCFFLKGFKRLFILKIFYYFFNETRRIKFNYDLMMHILMLSKSSHLSIVLLYFDGKTLRLFCEARTFSGLFS